MILKIIHTKTSLTGFSGSSLPNENPQTQSIGCIQEISLFMPHFSFHGNPISLQQGSPLFHFILMTMILVKLVKLRECDSPSKLSWQPSVSYAVFELIVLKLGWQNN